MSTDVQGMLVRIEATTQQLRQELARAESAVGKTSQRIDGDLGRVDAAFDRLEESAAQAGSVVDSALTGITAATVASVAGLGALIATTAAAGKELTSLSFLANASTAEFQRMAAGARSVGVDQGKLADVLKDVNDRVGEFASTGGGEMKDFFEQIAPKVGVTVQQFQKLSGPQALQLYYDSLEKAGLNQQEMTFYMEAMADEATALIPLLANGGKGFQEMGDRAERLGVVLSDLELSQLAELSKIAGEAGMAWEGVTNQLVAGLQPAISALVESLDGEGFSAAAQDMGDGIRFVIDNLDALVIAVGSLGAGRLAIRFVEGVQAISGYVQSVRQATEAERAHTQAVQASALEQVRRAEGELNAARIQAISTRGTVEHTAALSRQRQARLDLAVANQAYTAAQTAANTVTGTATALLRGALGLFGGPVGLVTMIGTAAAGWLLFSKNSDQANRSTIDLTKSVEEQRKEIEALNLAQANARLNNLQDEQRRWRDELAATTRTLEGQVGAFDKWGGNFSASQRERAAAWQEFTAALNRGEDVGQAAARLADMTGASEEMRTKIENAAAQLDVQRNSVEQNAAAQAMLEGHMRSLTGATRENTAATGENTGSKGGNTDAAQKYLEQLQKQLNAMRDKTALQAAERFLTEHSITAESELGQQILATATAKDRQREADTAATAARKSSTKAVKDEAKELQSLLDKLLPAEAAQREQVETIETLDEAWQKGLITLEQYSKAMSAAWAAQNKAEWDKANKAQEELNKTLKASNDAFEQLEDQLDPVRAASKRLADQQKVLRAEYDRGEISLERYNALLGRAQVEYDGVAKETSAWVKLTADAFERVNAAGADMWYEFFDTGRVTFDSLLGIGKRWAAEMANALTMRGLTAVFGGMLGMGGSSSALAADGVGPAAGGGFGLNEAWNAISGAYSLGTSGFGQAVLGGWNAGQGLLGGLQGAASAGWSYGTGALGSLGSGLGSMFGGGVQGGAGVMLDAAGNLVNYGAGGVLGSGLTAGALGISGIGGALYGYQQAGWKGAATGGLGAAGGAILGNILLPGIGGIIGGALGGMLGGSLFGGKWQTKDAGVAFDVQSGEVGSYTYEYQKKKGGLFGSGKSRVRYGEGDPKLAAYVQREYEKTADGVVELFQDLGFSIAESALDGLSVGMQNISLSGDAEQQGKQLQEGIQKFLTASGNSGTNLIGGGLVAGFTESITNAGKSALREGLEKAGVNLESWQYQWLDQLSGDQLAEQLRWTFDMSGQKYIGEEIAREVGSAVDAARKATFTGLTSLGDDVAKALDGVSIWQLTDEVKKLTGFTDDSYEALSRLVSEFNTVNLTFEALNVTMLKTNLASARMAEELVGMMGGIEEFAKSTGIYYQEFFSGTEKADDTVLAVSRAFADAGVKLPEVRSEFRAMVEDIDVTTESGRKMFATLMELAGQADSYYDIIESNATTELSKAAAAQQKLLSGISIFYDQFTSGAQKADDALEAIKKQLEEEGVSIPDSREDFVSLVNGIDKTTDSGKKLYETLMGVAGAADAYYDILESKATSSLAAAAEAQQALLSGMAVYYDQFTSPDQKAEDALAGARKQFADSGIDLPQTREDFIKLVSGIDTATDSGAKLYETLMKLSAAADTAYDIIESSATAELSKAAAAQQALLDGMSLYYDQFTSESKKVEDALEAVAEQFSAAGIALPETRDAFVALVDGLDTTTESGQKLFSVLMGMASSADTAYDIMEERQRQEQARAEAEQKELSGNLSLYYDQFTSESKKVEDALSGLFSQFAEIGLSMPETRDSFIELVEGLDTASDSGKKLFSALMRLASSADYVYDFAEEQARAQEQANADAAAREKAEREALISSTADAAKSSLSGLVSSISSAINAEKSNISAAYEKQASSIKESISSAGDSIAKLGSFAGKLRGTLGRIVSDSDGYIELSRKSAQGVIEDAISSSGRIQITDGIEKALEAVSAPSEMLFGSFEEYARDYWKTYFAIETLADRADDQLSADEQAVKALERQLDEAKRFHDAEIARLDGVLEGAEAQLDALLGINSSILSVKDAVSAFESALSAAQKLQGANSSITSVMGLGGVKRQVSSEGYILDELGNQMKLFGDAMRVVGNKVVGGAGATLNIGASGQLSWSTGDYEAWARQAGIPGFASGGLHSGGLRLVGERGPELEVTGPSRIYSARQTAALLGGGSETASEVRALRTEVAGLRSALVAIAKYTESTAYGVRQMNEIGLPKQEVV